MGEHTFTTTLTWTGSTGVGYQAYDRGHDLEVAGRPLRSSSAAAFGGDPTLPNPEQLLVAAASSCQLLSFLAVAARARIDVTGYTDDASGEMPEGNHPMWVTRIALRPRITLAGHPPRAKVARLVEVAHRECFIAASLRSEIVVDPILVGVSD